MIAEASAVAEFQTRSKRRRLDDLVAKLETLPANHPDQPRLGAVGLIYWRDHYFVLITLPIALTLHVILRG
jgi:hypothetical protein